MNLRSSVRDMDRRRGRQIMALGCAVAGVVLLYLASTALRDLFSDDAEFEPWSNAMMGATVGIPGLWFLWYAYGLLSGRVPKP